MNTPVRAVVTDLDGTLWWGESQIHPSTMPAVRGLAERGIGLLSATGRRVASARRGLEPIGLAGPTVVLSGAIGVDLSTGEEWHRGAFTAGQGLAVLDVLEAEGFSPVVHVSSVEVDSVMDPDCTTSPLHLAQFQHGQPQGVRAVLSTGTVVGFGMCGLDQAFAPAMSRVAAAVNDVAQAYVGPDHVMSGVTLMIGPLGVTKVSAVSGWVRDQGLMPAQILAVGDGSNDLEMLAWAGTSVAVAGGAAEAAGADHVIPRPQDGGWAELLGIIDGI